MSGELLAEHLLRQPATQIHEQHQSPLFSDIPPEIRSVIYRDVLLAFYDKSRPRSKYYPDYRPDFLYHDKIDAALLQTCRRIYLETYSLPISLNDHVLWSEASYQKPEKPELQYLARLQFKQHTNLINRVHIFALSHWLEHHFKPLTLMPTFRPRSLHITIRPTDWWLWDEGYPPSLRPAWLAFLKNVERLEEFILEMESIDRDKHKLHKIAEDAGKLHFDLADGRTLEPSGTLIKGQWMGPSAYVENIDPDGFYLVRFEKEFNGWHMMSLGSDAITESFQPPAPIVYQTVKLRWYATKAATGGT
ncbi:hypothetical protein V5O48_009983 [Marasmius crinis-equi]|uniref:Uncharacterized protein n=1 Tax=Marasmius crinis-equi TaxID=585013 RepID=A0ABR3F9N1_9AGAR